MGHGRGRRRARRRTEHATPVRLGSLAIGIPPEEVLELLLEDLVWRHRGELLAVFASFLGGVAEDLHRVDVRPRLGLDTG